MTLCIAETRAQFIEETPFVTQLWQVHDDLPHNHVRDIVQTRDGHIWVATPEGVARYTGVHFGIQFDRFHSGNTPAIPFNACSALAEDRAGRLWLGLDTGEIVRRGSWEFEQVPMPEGWPAAPIAAMVEDPSGGMLVLSGEGSVARCPADTPPRLLEATVPAGLVDLVRGADGTVWLLSSTGLHVLGPSGKVEDLGPAVCAGAGRNGGVWVLADRRLRKWQDGAWTEDTGPLPALDVAGTCLVESRDGALLVGTLLQGLLRATRDASGWKCHPVGALTGSRLNDVCEDHEGGIWVGTAGGGLWRFAPRRAMTVEVPGWSAPAGLLSVSSGEGNDLWIGSVNQGLFHRKEDGLTRQILPPALVGVALSSVHRVEGEGVLFGTHGRGLWVYDGEDCAPVPGWPWPDATVRCISASTNALWVGLSDGLAVLRSNRWERVKEGDQSLHEDVRCLAADTRGNLWFGTVGGGLGRLSDQGIRRFGRAQGLMSSTVYALLAEPDGTVWAGTQGGGLTRIQDDRISTITARQGLHNDTIGQILDDGRGRLWLATLGGVVSADKVALGRCANGELKSVTTILLDLKDGFTQTDFVCGSQPAATRTRDGRLWFTAGRGLGMLQPELVVQRQNLAPPPVIIKGLIANEVEVPLPAIGPSPPLRLQAGTRRLEFRYNALSYAAPRRVRFEYRLLGMDEAWVDAGSDRTVRYGRVPPGEYVFQVRGSNNDGVWNYEGASLAFYLVPYFHQTFLFRFILGLFSAILIATVAYSLARSRHQRRLARVRQREALELERGRIARDMHDEVGAKLTRIAILSRLAEGRQTADEKLGDLLDKITRTARESVKRFDEIVWAVNPHNDTLGNFADYLANYAVAYFDQTGIRCTLSIPAILPDTPLSSSVRHNLVRACEEAMGNALRHAEATQVAVSIAVDSAGLVIRVSDNGKGFSGDTDGPGADGLRNMTKRLTDIGGACIIDGTSSGTSVRMHIALHGVWNET